MMSVIVSDADHGGALLLVSKGAPGAVLACCNQVRQGRQDLPLDEARRKHLLAAADTLAGDALRTLAVAYRPLPAGAGLPTADGIAAGPGQAHALEQGLGVTGSEVTKQAARLILADDNFAIIVRAVKKAEASSTNCANACAIC